jgi:hypothetical protein
MRFAYAESERSTIVNYIGENTDIDAENPFWISAGAMAGGGSAACR